MLEKGGKCPNCQAEPDSSKGESTIRDSFTDNGPVKKAIKNGEILACCPHGCLDPTSSATFFLNLTEIDVHDLIFHNK